MPRAKNLRSTLLVLLLSACGSKGATSQPLRPSRPVSILVEVFDPVTDFVWENVSVRIAESHQEWSQCTCSSPVEDWRLTDATGQVLFDEFDLAAADVGFVVDSGRAVLGSRSFEDTATVLLEVDAVGFSPVFVEVPLTWSQPDVFVAVPFQ